MLALLICTMSHFNSITINFNQVSFENITIFTSYHNILPAVLPLCSLSRATTERWWGGEVVRWWWQWGGDDSEVVMRVRWWRWWWWWWWWYWKLLQCHGSSSVWLPVTFSGQSEEHPDHSWVPIEKDREYMHVAQPSSASKYNLQIQTKSIELDQFLSLTGSWSWAMEKSHWVREIGLAWQMLFIILWWQERAMPRLFLAGSNSSDCLLG